MMDSLTALFVLRFIRYFTDAGISVILYAYLMSLNWGDVMVLIYCTALIMVDCCLTLYLARRVDTIYAGRRKVLMLGSGIRVLAGLIFSLTTNFYILMVAGTLAMYSLAAPGSDGNIIDAIHLASVVDYTIAKRGEENGKKVLPVILGYFTAVGYIAVTFGGLVSAGLVHRMASNNQSIVFCSIPPGTEDYSAYISKCPQQSMQFYFFLTALVALLEVTLVNYAVTGDIEAKSWTAPIRHDPTLTTTNERDLSMLETGELSLQPSDDPVSSKHCSITWGINNRESSAAVMGTIFSVVLLDACGTSFVSQSWIASWFSMKRLYTFDEVSDWITLSVGAAGFFAVLSSWLFVNRIGAVNTMALTRIPSGILLILIPCMATGKTSLTLVLAFFCMAALHQPARDYFVGMSVLSEERTAAYGLVHMAAVIGKVLSPLISAFWSRPIFIERSVVFNSLWIWRWAYSDSNLNTFFVTYLSWFVAGSFIIVSNIVLLTKYYCCCSAVMTKVKQRLQGLSSTTSVHSYTTISTEDDKEVEGEEGM